MANEFSNDRQTGEVVVGYFEDAEQAQAAIFDLRDEGFDPGQVGAAFHSSARAGVSSSIRGPGSAPSAGESSDESSEKPQGIHVPYRKEPGTTGLGSGASGVRSSDTAVTPAGLAYGSGTLNAGPSRPGPITGTESVQRVLHGDQDPYREIESNYVGPQGGVAPATGSFSQDDTSTERRRTTGTHASDGDWWSKLKDFFGADSSGKKQSSSSSTVNPSTGGVNDSSMNFGTGEGHLGVTAPGSAGAARSSDGGLYSSSGEERLVDDSDYEGSDLEGSFSGMGVSSERSRFLSRQVSRGGAIVTVQAGSRTADAERILERNGARVRYEQASGATSGTSGEGQGDVAYDQSPGQNRVVLFGEVLRVHRGRFDEGTAPSERKAS